MNIIYIANVRMPTEKAHGIQIAKMCEAFIARGADVTLVVPDRRTVTATVREFYGLKTDIRTIRLPIIDTYQLDAAGFIIGSVSFMISSFLFILARRIRGEKFTIYTVDTDTFSSSFLPLAGVPVFTEMHNGKPAHIAQRVLFHYICGVITINSILVGAFQEKFRHSRARYLVEPNGVDAKLFYPRDRAEARRHLGLNGNAKIALYVGRFFDWKGLEILPAATALTHNVMEWYLVGGTTDDFVRVTGMQPDASMHFVGSVSQADVVWWMAAADALVVLGTRRDAQSYYYTSPMKLFEYMLSGRIIIASETPAIREIISDREALFYAPDSAEGLAAKACEAMISSDAVKKRIEAAINLSRRYSWHDRAERILRFIEDTLRT